MKPTLEQKLAPYGQTHLLAFWDQLWPGEQDRLASQIERLDLGLIDRLYREQGTTEDWSTKAERATPPPAARLNSTSNPYSKDEAIGRGRAALDADQVAVLIVAGGQGTRLGFDHPKGMFPIGPVSGSSLFRILLEKVLATSRRHRVRVPLYIMTSQATHDETAQYLKEHSNFGLPADDIHLFCQGTMPAVDLATGGVLLAEKGQLALSPDGHGGMLAALAGSGGLDRLEQQGIRQVFYCQVDNPLVRLCDAEFLGYHLLAESELSTQVVAKRAPLERVGNVAMVDGRMTIIEYSDLPQAVAEKRNPDGSLYLWAGNTGVHVFELSFLGRMSREASALPFHLAKKKVPYVNDRGALVEPETPNAIKFERFIFDLLPAANNPFVMEVDAARAFAPVKNAPGEASDTPESVQARMVALHGEWLRRVDVSVAPGVPVEISPLFALDDADMLEQVLRGNLEPDMHLNEPRFFV